MTVLDVERTTELVTIDVINVVDWTIVVLDTASMEVAVPSTSEDDVGIISKPI